MKTKITLIMAILIFISIGSCVAILPAKTNTDHELAAFKRYEDSQYRARLFFWVTPREIVSDGIVIWKFKLIKRNRKLLQKRQ